MTEFPRFTIPARKDLETLKFDNIEAVLKQLEEWGVPVETLKIRKLTAENLNAPEGVDYNILEGVEYCYLADDPHFVVAHGKPGEIDFTLLGLSLLENNWDMPEDKEFTLDFPPGDEWVLLRSGGAPALVHKGNRPPVDWIEEGHGHIFVRNEFDKTWLGYSRDDKVLVHPPVDWQNFAESAWEQEMNPVGEQRKKIVSLDIFSEDGKVDWKKFFQFINKNNKTRDEIFPDGTEGLSEDDVISRIKEKYPTFLAGTIDPIEFPELIDEGLRQICDLLNQTVWSRSSDGCTGHPSTETEHLNIGYGQPYLRLALDLSNPNTKRFLDTTEQLIQEWQGRLSNVKIDSYQENLVGTNEEPRLIRYSMMFDISCPEDTKEKEYFDSEECRLISAKFFKQLKEAIRSL